MKHIVVLKDNDVLFYFLCYNSFMYHVFIANSALMLNLLHELDDVASSSFPVLIFGEKGIGKELVAEQIHLRGSSKDFPFVRIKCVCAEDNILDEKSLKEGTTLFFDEISLLSLAQQEHLLKLVQERLLPQTLRIVASSSKDLENLVREGKFNKNLFTYLNILPITIPPLRQHADDIEGLVMFFLRIYSRIMNKNVENVSSVAIKLLKEYFWPGNVRELKNIIEHAVMVCEGSVVNASDLSYLQKESSLSDEILNSSDRTLKCALDSFKRQYLLGVLNETKWNKAAAARILDVQRTYIFKLMKELDISLD